MNSRVLEIVFCHREVKTLIHPIFVSYQDFGDVFVCFVLGVFWYWIGIAFLGISLFLKKTGHRDSSPQN